MMQSLLIKLGMFAVTMAVVFWIGWTLPASFDRDHDLAAKSLEGAPSANMLNRERTAEINRVPATVEPAPQAMAPALRRSHQGLLDLNRATEQDFDALPGIGPNLAERIMAYRQSVGAFHSLDELRSVKGVGNKKFERIRPLVTVTPDTISPDRGKKTT